MTFLNIENNYISSLRFNVQISQMLICNLCPKITIQIINSFRKPTFIIMIKIWLIEQKHCWKILPYLWNHKHFLFLFLFSSFKESSWQSEWMKFVWLNGMMISSYLLTDFNHHREISIVNSEISFQLWIFNLYI